MTDSQDIQFRQYGRPYHHDPYFDEMGEGHRRGMDWGFEYLLYSNKLREHVLAENPKSVLDVGCGDGRFLKGLPAAIDRRVGLDINDRALGFARAFSPDVDFRA